MIPALLSLTAIHLHVGLDAFIISKMCVPRKWNTPLISERVTVITKKPAIRDGGEKKSKTEKALGENIVTQVPALVIPLFFKTVLAIVKPCPSSQESSNIYYDHSLVGRHHVYYASVTLLTAPVIHRSSFQCISPDLGTT